MVGRAQVNKPHKTRFSSKSSRNIHKTSLKVKNGIAKPEKPSRAARNQQKKTKRDQKIAAVVNEKRALSGSNCPPRVIVLVGLSAQADLDSLERDLLSLLSSKSSDDLFPTVASDEYKIRVTVMKAPHGDLPSFMEMAKVADVIAFIATANSLYEDGSSDFIDSFGSLCLSVFRAVGAPSSVVLMRDLPSDLKRRNESKKFCTSSLASELPKKYKFYPADTKDELHQFVGFLKEQRLTSRDSHEWRNQRAYVASQKVDMLDHDFVSGKCTLLLTGYLRARSLSVNQLVHVSGAGDYQLSKIEILKDPYALNQRKGRDTMDSDDVQDVQVIRSLIPDSSKQEPLLVENIPDPNAGEQLVLLYIHLLMYWTMHQTWPTEKDMAEADERMQKKLKKRKLPPGTSEYQAAWIVGDSDEDDAKSSDEEGDGMILDSGENDAPSFDAVRNPDFDEDEGSLYLGDSDIETETDSVMVDGENMTREQIADDIKRLKEAHAQNEEFPDEVDTPLDVPARKRFAKYRNLKSFRTSSWDPKESLPQDYARIFAFDNFARTQKHVFAKAMELDNEVKDDTIPPGTYARLYIKEVPIDVASKTCLCGKNMPIITSSLLQHESKMSVLHFSIKKHDSYTEPIKAKEELIFHVGFRQFVARPVFSTESVNSDKHKMERFLRPGCTLMASVYAPISFPPLTSFSALPMIAMKNVGASLPVVAAVGSLKRVDPDRIILKKIILTGYPQRVSKVKATVRYMFHYPEDVRWFKPVEVRTKCGRRGRIKEPVGTHGAMKCLFNGVIQQHDTVCMDLYKRVYPKWPERKYPLL